MQSKTVRTIAGREVSAQILPLTLEGARRHGVEVSKLLAGIITSEELANRRHRLSWAKVCLFFDRLEKAAGNREELEQIGRYFYDGWQVLRLTASAFVSPNRFALFMINTFSKPSFLNLNIEYLELSPDTARVITRLHDGYPLCHGMLVASAGAFSAMPQVLGLEPATVKLTIDKRTAIFDITYPPSKTLPARAARALSAGSLAAVFQEMAEMGADFRHAAFLARHPAHAEVAASFAERLESRSKLWSLTSRESEVLSCVVRGYGNKEIATELAIARGTVEMHVKNVLRKVSVSGRNQLTARFWESF